MVRWCQKWCKILRVHIDTGVHTRILLAQLWIMTIWHMLSGGYFFQCLCGPQNLFTCYQVFFGCLVPCGVIGVNWCQNWCSNWCMQGLVFTRPFFIAWNGNPNGTTGLVRKIKRCIKKVRLFSDGKVQRGLIIFNSFSFSETMAIAVISPPERLFWENGQFRTAARYGADQVRPGFKYDQEGRHALCHISTHDRAHWPPWAYSAVDG